MSGKENMEEILSIIEYKGGNDAIVWKYPTVNFNRNSQVIVQESQVAIFSLNGEFVGVFDKPGSHPLNTDKVPFLNEKLVALSTGEVYHSEVYFVSLLKQLPMNWGINPAIEYQDNTLNCPFKLGIRGTVSISIDDPVKLVKKIVGTADFLGREGLLDYILPIVIQEARKAFAKVLLEYQEQNISVNKLNQYTSEMADIVKQSFCDIYEYGIGIASFGDIVITYPEEYHKLQTMQTQHALDEVHRSYTKASMQGQHDIDVMEKKLQQELDEMDVEHQEKVGMRKVTLENTMQLKKAQTEADISVINSEASAKGRELEGKSYIRERLFDLAEKYAENSGNSGGVTSDLGLSALGGFGPTNADVITNIVNAATQSDNGERRSTAPLLEVNDGISVDDEFQTRLNRLMAMKDAGAIDAESFQKIKQELVDKYIR